MKRIPIYKMVGDNVTKEKRDDFFSTSFDFFGLRVFPKNTTHPYGYVGLMFCFFRDVGLSDTKYMLVQTQFEIEDESERDFWKNSMYNMENYPKEMVDAIAPTIGSSVGGDTSFSSNFVFSKEHKENKDYYKFEALYSNINTKTEYLRDIYCSAGDWIRVQEILYWLLVGMPLSTTMFEDDRYNNIKIGKVESMLFQGSTVTNYGGIQVAMAHFIAYYKLEGHHIENLSSLEYPFNVPANYDTTKVFSKPLSNDFYQQMFADDDLCAPQRFFIISGPEKCFALLGVDSRDAKGFTILTVDPETAERIHWCDWDKHIYLQKEGGDLIT